MELERIVVGGMDVTEGVIERLKEMRALRVLEATKRLSAIAKAGGERRILRDENGSAAGHVEMQVDAASYHYWGQRLGYQCWNDPQFKREYLRDNDYARVKTVTERPTILCGFEGSKRSSSNYAWPATAGQANNETKLAA